MNAPEEGPWLHPRAAVDAVMQACDLSRELAIHTLCMRLWDVQIVATVGRVAGHTVAGSSIVPSFQPQLIPPNIWDSDVFCSPNSTIWHTGDLAAFVPAGPIRMFNIRLRPAHVFAAIGEISAGNVHASRKPSRILAGPADPTAQVVSLQPIVAPKWDWEAVLIELIALADDLDGLRTIEGFDPPRRGSQARLNEWISAAFSRLAGGEPAGSEIKLRSQAILNALDLRERARLNTENRE